MSGGRSRGLRGGRKPPACAPAVRPDPFASILSRPYFVSLAEQGGHVVRAEVETWEQVWILIQRWFERNPNRLLAIFVAFHLVYEDELPSDRGPDWTWDAARWHVHEVFPRAIWAVHGASAERFRDYCATFGASEFADGNGEPFQHALAQVMDD